MLARRPRLVQDAPRSEQTWRVTRLATGCYQGPMLEQKRQWLVTCFCGWGARVPVSLAGAGCGEAPSALR